MDRQPSLLYTKCFKHEFEIKKQTLSDSGIFERFFFENPDKLINQVGLSELEIVIKVPIEAFGGSSYNGSSPCFTYVEDGVWRNQSPLLMKFLSAL